MSNSVTSGATPSPNQAQMMTAQPTITSHMLPIPELLSEPMNETSAVLLNNSVQHDSQSVLPSTMATSGNDKISPPLSLDLNGLEADLYDAFYNSGHNDFFEVDALTGFGGTGQAELDAFGLGDTSLLDELWRVDGDIGL